MEPTAHQVRRPHAGHWSELDAHTRRRYVRGAAILALALVVGGGGMVRAIRWSVAHARAEAERTAGPKRLPGLGPNPHTGLIAPLARGSHVEVDGRVVGVLTNTRIVEVWADGRMNRLTYLEGLWLDGPASAALLDGRTAVLVASPRGGQPAVVDLVAGDPRSRPPSERKLWMAPRGRIVDLY
jgi:hypothetical protein